MPIASQTRRGMLVAFIAAIAGCGLVGVLCLLKGNMGRIEQMVLASTALVGAAAVLGLASAAVWERGQYHWLGPIGVGCAAVGLVLSLSLVWDDYIFGFRATHLWQVEWFWKPMGLAWVGAVAFPHIGLLGFARLHQQYHWVRIVTITSIALLAGVVSLIILLEPPNDDIFRVLGILAIVDVGGTLMVPILHRLSSIRTREAVRTTALHLSLTCPRCSTTQQLPAGRSRCGQCGLKFTIDIEEEQCDQCGYALYMLQSEQCPECGAPIMRAATPPNNVRS